MRVQVIEAIRELNFKVVPEAVAVHTGLPVLAVTSQLNAIATETGADLRVSNIGQIEYLFKPDFQSAFLHNSMRKTSSAALNAFLNCFIIAAKLIHLAALALFRASVGILMIASVVAVIIFMIVAIIKRFEHAPDGAVDVLAGDAGATGAAGAFLLAILHFFRFFLTDWIYDWWFWDRYYMSDYRPYLPNSKKSKQKPTNNLIYSDSYWVDSFFHFELSDFSNPDESKKKIKAKSRQQRRAAERFDFLTICFQFVFGGPDLNADLEERNWKYIGATITNNKGVVVAEQIAPFMDDIATDSEYWMIPVLSRFNGYPEVSDSGNIIYVFPQFKPTISLVTPKAVPFEKAELDNLYNNSLVRRSKTDLSKTVQQAEIPQIELPTFKSEELIPFVGFESNRLFGAILMALIEICGAVYLFININAMPWLIPYEPLITFMLVYGILFLTIPVLRYFILLQKNKKREMRNSKRFDAYARLVGAKSKVKQKLQEAELCRNSVETVTSSSTEIAYSTEQDHLEQ